MMGWPVDELDSAEFHQIKRALSRELEVIWRDWYWPELTITERRQCADDYDSTATYAALAQVFHPGSNAYYVALRAATNQPPATLSGTSTWTVNKAYWAVLARSYRATAYNSGTTYAVGDQVTYAEDGETYQLHTAAVSGTAPNSTNYWGRVPAFAPAIAWVQNGFTAIGDVAGIWASNPDAFQGAIKVPWMRTAEGLALYPAMGTEAPRPWVRFLQRPHRLTGDFYNSDTAYTATDAEDLTGTATAINMSDTSGIGYAGRASLRARTQHFENQVAYLLYLVTAGDGQGGWFYFSTANTTADDGVDVLKPNDIASGSAGRWIRNS